jgi:hypothetical protein
MANGLGALLLVALALWVLSIKPRRRASLLLAVFSGCFGGWTVMFYWLDNTDPAAGPFEALGVLFALLASVALVGLALTWPTPLERRERRLLVAPSALALVGFAVARVVDRGDWASMLAFLQYPAERALLGNAFLGAIAVFVAAFAVTLPLLALRFASTSDLQRRRQLALMGATLCVWPGLAGGLVLETRGIAFLYGGGFNFAIMVGSSALLWLWAARGEDAARARNVALFQLAMFLGGMLLQVAVGGFQGTVRNGFVGIIRTVTLVALAFAILRHQLLGIDVKVKWTIRRGTLAGMFLAVFFVVGQLVQNLLSKELDLIAGAVAAGLMLFALSPLQKVAERVADAAMPGVKAVGEMNLEERVRVYREAVRGAWADGILTHDERDMLDRLCASLGVHDSDARRIEREEGQRLRAEAGA